MSNFRAMTKANDPLKYPEFKDWQPANWLDNYFGGHQYGIQFDGSMVFKDNGDFVYSPDMEMPEQPQPQGQQADSELRKHLEKWLNVDIVDEIMQLVATREQAARNEPALIEVTYFERGIVLSMNTMYLRPDETVINELRNSSDSRYELKRLAPERQDSEGGL
jgi:hypothetical protein